MFRSCLSTFSVRWTTCTMIMVGITLMYILRVNMSVAVQRIQTELNWTNIQKGLVLSSFYWGYALGQIPSGQLIRIFGAKFLFGMSVLIPALFSFFMPMACRYSFVTAFAVRALIGLFESAGFPSVYYFISVWIPKEEKTILVSFLFSGIYFGEILGFSMSGLLTESSFKVGDWSFGGWSSVFYVFGWIGLIWYPFWHSFVFELPNMHPGISKAELELIAKDKELMLEGNPIGIKSSNAMMLELVPQISSKVDKLSVRTYVSNVKYNTLRNKFASESSEVPKTFKDSKDEMNREPHIPDLETASLASVHNEEYQYILPEGFDSLRGKFPRSSSQLDLNPLDTGRGEGGDMSDIRHSSRSDFRSFIDLVRMIRKNSQSDNKLMKETDEDDAALLNHFQKKNTSSSTPSSIRTDIIEQSGQMRSDHFQYNSTDQLLPAIHPEDADTIVDHQLDQMDQLDNMAGSDHETVVTNDYGHFDEVETDVDMVSNFSPRGADDPLIHETTRPSSGHPHPNGYIQLSSQDHWGTDSEPKSAMDKYKPFEHGGGRQQSFPWSVFFSNPISLTIFLSAWQYGWISLLLLSEIQSYIMNVLHYDLQTTSTLCVLPYLGLFVSTNSFGCFFNYLENHRDVSNRKSRALALFIGLIGSSLSLLISGLFHRNRGLSLCFLTTAQVLFGASNSCYGCIFTDVSPRHSVLFHTVANTIGSVAGIVAPLFVEGCLTLFDGPGGPDGWSAVFAFTLATSSISIFLWIIFVRAEVVPAFNSPPSPRLQRG